MSQSIPVFYPNMLKLYSECPLKFYYKYLEQISTPILDKGFQTGKNIHSLAAYYLKGENIQKFELVLTSKESQLWSVLKESPYLKLNIVGIEKNIIIEFGTGYIGGRIDAIVENDKNYFILDYKTGGISSDMTYDFQTMVYLLLCAELYEGYKSLSFVYLDLKNKKDVVISFNESLKHEYVKRLTNIINSISNFNPSACNSKCENSCEFKKICDAC